MTDAMPPAAPVPPHDLEAEAAVVSAMLLDRRAVDFCLDVVRPQHFFLDAHRWVCEAVYALAAVGSPVDVVTVAAWLRDKDRLAQVGGSSVLAGLCDAVPFVANVDAYARIVVRKAAVRRMIATCQRIAAEGYGEAGTTEEFVARAAHAVEHVARDARGGLVSQDVFSEKQIFTELAQAMVAGVQLQRCTTGIPDIDSDIGGYFAGMVSWFGAPTHWGKSSFAVMTYDALAAAGKRVLLVTCEDTRSLFARRILARRAGVSAYGLREQTLSDRDFSKLLGVAEMSTSVPFLFEAIGQRAEAIASRIKHMCAVEHFDLVMVDYLQAISSSRRHENKRVETGHIARILTDAIKNSGASGLLFSQLKRLEDGRTPTINDLKEAGEIENMAENVFLGIVDKQGRKVLRVAKAKDAAKQDYLMQWDPLSCSFGGATRVEAQ